jgi:hypothetical protein
MSNRNDPSQTGGVPGNRPKSARKVPTPNGTAIIRATAAAVDQKYAEDHKMRPAQKVGGLQDWRRG